MSNVHPLSRSLTTCSHGGHRKRVNQSLPQIGKWTRLENVRPELKRLAEQARKPEFPFFNAVVNSVSLNNGTSFGANGDPRTHQ